MGERSAPGRERDFVAVGVEDGEVEEVGFDRVEVGCAVDRESVSVHGLGGVVGGDWLGLVVAGDVDGGEELKVVRGLWVADGQVGADGNPVAAGGREHDGLGDLPVASISLSSYWTWLSSVRTMMRSTPACGSQHFR